MAIPFRGKTSQSTYFITASTFQKRALLQKTEYAQLFLDVLAANRAQRRLSLHGYVIMPDHFHLLLTPQDGTTLERALQFIKGGFSFRIRKELGYLGEVWQTSFYDRRVRDLAEYIRLLRYIHLNPVRRHLVERAEEYSFSSVNSRIELDELPHRLESLVASSQ